MKSTILKNLGYEKLTDMQQQMSDAFVVNKDIVLLSPTGSGKTLGFLLPVVMSLDKNEKEIQAVILSPTRELALQIEDVFKKMKTGFKVNTCYGGHSVKTEINNLSEPPAVLIGTPGRVDDLLRRKILDVSAVTTIVLDEFDKSLQLGFHEEMKFIVGNLSSNRKQVLTSATDLEKIPDFIRLKNPLRLNFLIKENESSSRLVLRKVVADEKNKQEILLQLICKLGEQTVFVFVNHRETVERLSDFLERKKMVHGFYHGGMDQERRERALVKFRNGSVRVLITTDLASRGLDIPAIGAVVHYDLPLKEEEFIHRNGRTARMDAEGKAFVLASAEEVLPPFIPAGTPEEKLSSGLSLPQEPSWTTLYIDKGKKDKINKVDIVGFLHQKGKLLKEDVGLIEVKDTLSYVAVKSDKVNELLSLIKHEKLKNVKAKIEKARE